MMAFRASMAAFPLAILLLLTGEARTQWNATGEGATATAEAMTVYSAPKGGKVEGVLIRNELVAADGPGRRFKETDGRLKIRALYRDGKKLREISGWVNPADLSPSFEFPCSCAQGCWPFDEGARELGWNHCFMRAAALAAARSLAPIRTPAAEAATGSPAPAPPPGGSR